MIEVRWHRRSLGECGRKILDFEFFFYPFKKTHSLSLRLI
jgi:hypothetical protein